MTVNEVMDKICVAREKLHTILEQPIPDDDLVDILHDYIDMLGNLTVKK